MGVTDEARVMGHDGMVMMDGMAVGKGRAAGRVGLRGVVVGRLSHAATRGCLSVGGVSCFGFGLV